MAMFDSIPRFFNWWQGELSALVPPRLAAWFTGAPSARQIVFERDRAEIARIGRVVHVPFSLPPDCAAFEEAARLIGRGAIVDVTWPADAALSRHHSLPAAARSRVASIIELDLARSTPLKRDEIEWRYNVQRGVDGGLAVEQYILKRADIDQLTAGLQRAGLLLRRLRVAVPDGVAVAPFVDRTRELMQPARVWRWLNVALFALCLGLAFHMITAPHFARRAALAEVTAEADELRAQAVALRQSVDQAMAQRDAISALMRVFVETPRAIDTLRELTARLPDTVWLSELQISDRDARFSGFIRGSAAELVIELGKSPVFVNPRLTGPVSANPGDGAERFEIAIDLKRAS